MLFCHCVPIIDSFDWTPSAALSWEEIVSPKWRRFCLNAPSTSSAGHIKQCNQHSSKPQVIIIFNGLVRSKTSQELWMLSMSLFGCQSLTFNVISICQLCHQDLVNHSQNCYQCICLCLCLLVCLLIHLICQKGHRCLWQLCSARS